MKKRKKISLIIAITLLSLLLLPFIVLSIGAVQQYIAKRASEFVSDKLGADFRVESLSIHHFSHIRLDRVSLRDRQDSLMARIDRLDVSLKLWPLVNGRIELGRISIDSLEANLYVLPDSTLNLQFVIDAFPIDPNFQAPDINLPKIKISRSHLRYSDFRSGLNLDLTDFNLAAAFSLKDHNVLDLNLEELRFGSRGRPLLSNLSLKAHKDSNTAWAKGLELRLRNSELKIERAKVVFLKQNDSIDWLNSAYSIHIAPSSIVPQDLSSLLPALRNLDKPIHLELATTGRITDFRTRKFKLDYNHTIDLDASLVARRITDLDRATATLTFNRLNFDISAIAALIGDVTGRPLNLPKELNRLGVCNFAGTARGSIRKIDLDGTLSTAPGRIATNIALSSPDTFRTIAIAGKINTSNINVAQIIPDPALGLGPTQLSAEVDAHFMPNGKHHIDLLCDLSKVTFKNYTYHNLLIDGCLTENFFQGKINLDDRNGHLSFDGRLDNDPNIKNLAFRLSVAHVNLNRLNIISKSPDMEFGFALNSNLTLDRQNNINGRVTLDTLAIRNGEKSYLMNSFTADAVNNADTNYINLRSDLINGSIYGRYRYDQILKCLVKTLSRDLPRLSELNIGEPEAATDLTISFDIESLRPLMQALDIPFYTTEASTVHIAYNSTKERLRSYIIVPELTNGKISVDSTIINLNNYKGVNLSLRTATDLNIGHIDANLSMKMANSRLSTSLGWSNDKDEQFMFGGELLVNTDISVENEQLTTDSHIMPTEFVLHGVPWQFYPAQVKTGPEGISISRFGIKSDDDQEIALDGIISHNPDDTLSVGIHGFMLEYLSEMLPRETSISFGGRLTADGTVANILSGDPRINLTASSDKFSFDGAEVGAMSATCGFDLPTNTLSFLAYVYNQTDTVATLDGHYYFARDSLDIRGLANGLDVSFLNYYIKDVFGTAEGRGYGNVHIYSVTKKDVAVDAEVLARDASIGVNFLGTRFYFTDSIFVNRNIIDFRKINLTDPSGHRGTLRGSISHNFFRDMKFGLAIHTDTMLVMNTTAQQSPSFYGHVIATGDIFINGDDRAISISGKAATVPGTKVTIPVDNYTATESSFITFVTPMAEKKQKKSEPEKATPQSNVLVNLLLDLCPETEATIIVDSRTRDRLDARASGSLRFTYDVNNEDMNLYGSLNVTDGTYNFSLQDFIRKEFKIKEGGKISWAGDVMDAQLDVQGYYRLKADIAELLDAGALQNVSRTMLPVECLLNIKGSLTQPALLFDIDLPDSDEELNRAMHNAISTQEVLNREIVGLLLLGKFFKTENMSSAGFTSQSELYSTISSTISSQLNNWASQMFDNWGFGVNFMASDDQSQTNNGVEFNFQYAPTSRILINGNVGYRENTGNSNDFIGDFDFEYKLLQSGRLRIKAYTHTNDYKEFKKGLTTQGVGIVWTESFNSGRELGETYRRYAQQAKANRKQRAKERKEKAALKRQEREKKREERQAEKQAATKPEPTEQIAE